MGDSKKICFNIKLNGQARHTFYMLIFSNGTYWMIFICVYKILANCLRRVYFSHASVVPGSRQKIAGIAPYLHPSDVIHGGVTLHQMSDVRH